MQALRINTRIIKAKLKLLNFLGKQVNQAIYWKSFCQKQHSYLEKFIKMETFLLFYILWIV